MITNLSQQAITQILDNIPDMIVLFTPRGEIVYVNKMAQSISGFSEKELVGKKVQTLKNLGAKSLLKMVKSFARMIAGKKVKPFKIVVKTKNNETKHLSISLYLIDLDQENKALLVVGHDVSGEIYAKSMLGEKEVELERTHKLLVSSELRMAALKKELRTLD